MRLFLALLATATLLAAIVQTAMGLDGQITTHDPSTIATENGKYYVYSTGNNIPFLISDDGYTWRRGGSLLDRIPESVHKLSPNNNGINVWAPDVIKLGDVYAVYYSVSAWGEFASVVGLVTGPTLDPNSPDFKWTDRGPIVWSDGKEDLNAIDPGVFRDAKDGSLWLSYGSYHGTVRLVELDPKTGLRKDPEKPATIIASQSESSVIISHDDWYYLVTNHGSCCNGATSTYNLRVGRAKSVTGPYLDSFGADMARGGGDILLAAGDRKIGPGHFGLLDLGNGVQKFSLHYESDLDHDGAAVLDIRPLSWADGWPVAGETLKDGTYQIRALQAGTVVQVDVPGVPVIQRLGRNGRGGRGGRGAQTTPTTQPGNIATELAAAPATSPAPPPTTYPAGKVGLKLAGYLLQEQQKWNIAAVPGAGGTPGSLFFKITLANGRAMQAGDDGSLSSAESFTGGDAQLWQIDQLIDGSYRIMPKGRTTALSVGRGNNVALAEFEYGNARQHWLIKAP